MNQPAIPTTSDDFDALDQILDDMRGRDDEIPQWEFCEGFMAATLCNRRALPLAEVLSVLLGSGDDGQTLFILTATSDPETGIEPGNGAIYTAQVKIPHSGKP